MNTHRTSGLDRQNAWKLYHSKLLRDDQQAACRYILMSNEKNGCSNHEVKLSVWREYREAYLEHYKDVMDMEKAGWHPEIAKKEKSLLGPVLIAAYIIMFACSIMQDETKQITQVEQISEEVYDCTVGGKLIAGKIVVCNHLRCYPFSKEDEIKWKREDKIIRGKIDRGELSEREIDSLGWGNNPD